MAFIKLVVLLLLLYVFIHYLLKSHSPFYFLTSFHTFVTRFPHMIQRLMFQLTFFPTCIARRIISPKSTIDGALCDLPFSSTFPHSCFHLGMSCTLMINSVSSGQSTWNQFIAQCNFGFHASLPPTTTLRIHQALLAPIYFFFCQNTVLMLIVKNSNSFQQLFYTEKKWM